MIFTVILIVTCSTAVIEAKPQYFINLVDVDWNVTTKNNFEMSWEITRPTRGRFAMSGIMDFKEDINSHNCTGAVDVYYSEHGTSYVMTPFRYPRQDLTNGINIMYKKYLMAELKECSVNPIDFEGEFVPPVTKRRVTYTNCFIPSDNLPSHMRFGYYKILIIVEGELGFVLNILMKLEEL